MCVKHMKFKDINGNLIDILPTHYKCVSTGVVLPVENDQIWILQDKEDRQNSRWKIQTADGKSSCFHLASKPYFTTLHRQTEISSKNHFPSGNCQPLSNQCLRGITPDGNSVNKSLKNSRWKIRFGPYCLWS